MKKEILYPEGYKEPDPVAEFDEDANYEMWKDTVRPMVEAMVAEKPMPKCDIIAKLGKAGAPGSPECHRRVIEAIDKEWHPSKFEEAVIEEPVKVVKEK